MMRRSFGQVKARAKSEVERSKDWEIGALSVS